MCVLWIVLGGWVGQAEAQSSVSCGSCTFNVSHEGLLTRGGNCGGDCGIDASGRKPLHLENLGIRSLKNGTFDGLSSLQDLYLQNNKLESLPAPVFDELSSLEFLYLNNNKISCISSQTFTQVSSSIITLDLRENNLSCYDPTWPGIVRWDVNLELCLNEEQHCDDNEITFSNPTETPTTAFLTKVDSKIAIREVSAASFDASMTPTGLDYAFSVSAWSNSTNRAHTAFREAVTVNGIAGLRLRYQYRTTPRDGQWTFTTISPRTESFTFNYSSSQFHSWYHAERYAHIFVGSVSNNVRTITQSSGQITLSLNAGQSWGFHFSGSHYDLANIMDGQVTIWKDPEMNPDEASQEMKGKELTPIRPVYIN